MKKQISYVSSDGMTRLHGVIWEPEGEPRAIVQLAHGMVEYVERYGDFAEFLNVHGILVAGNDHLGHGDSINGEEDRGYFAERKGDNCVLKDLHRMTLVLQKKYPNIPHFLFGHSMGSFFTRRYLCVYPDEIDGAMICGTGWQPKAVLAGACLLTKAEMLLHGGRFRSQWIDKLAFGAMNRTFEPTRTPKDWLCRNEAIVDAYIRDAKCGFLFTLNGYYGLFRTMMLAQKRSRLKKMEKRLPVLFIAGAADPVGKFGKGVARVAKVFEKLGMEDVECILYPEMRHEILNEIGREAVFADVLFWLEERI